MSKISILKKIRLRWNVSLKGLAKEIGYTPSYISRTERMIIPPSGDYIRDFMRYFELDSDSYEYRAFLNERMAVELEKIHDKFKLEEQ